MEDIVDILRHGRKVAFLEISRHATHSGLFERLLLVRIGEACRTPNLVRLGKRPSDRKADLPGGPRDQDLASSELHFRPPMTCLGKTHTGGRPALQGSLGKPSIYAALQRAVNRIFSCFQPFARKGW